MDVPVSRLSKRSRIFRSRVDSTTSSANPISPNRLFAKLHIGRSRSAEPLRPLPPPHGNAAEYAPDAAPGLDRAIYDVPPPYSEFAPATDLPLPPPPNRSTSQDSASSTDSDPEPPIAPSTAYLASRFTPLPQAPPRECVGIQPRPIVRVHNPEQERRRLELLDTLLAPQMPTPSIFVAPREPTSLKQPHFVGGFRSSPQASVEFHRQETNKSADWVTSAQALGMLAPRHYRSASSLASPISATSSSACSTPASSESPWSPFVHLSDESADPEPSPSTSAPPPQLHISPTREEGVSVASREHHASLPERHFHDLRALCPSGSQPSHPDGAEDADGLHPPPSGASDSSSCESSESFRTAVEEREEDLGDEHVPYVPTFVCSICLDSQPVEDSLLVDVCEHRFCRDCLTSYVHASLSDPSATFPIPCPSCTSPLRRDRQPGSSARALGKLHLLSLRRLFRTKHRQPAQAPDSTVAGSGTEAAALASSTITRDLMELLELPEQDLDVWTEMELQGCSVEFKCPACVKTARISREDFLNAPDIIECPLPHCRKATCRKCSQVVIPNVAHSCDGRLELEYIMRQNGYKHCPGCQTPTEKVSGCNHMTCGVKGCNTHFCYVCGGKMIQSTKSIDISAAVTAHWPKCPGSSSA